MKATGRYMKVWNVNKVTDRFVSIDLGDSNKKKDGTWQNWTHFNAMIVGEAVEEAKNLKKGDTIDVDDSLWLMEEYTDAKGNKRWGNRLLVFKFHESGGAKKTEKKKDLVMDDNKTAELEAMLDNIEF